MIGSKKTWWDGVEYDSVLEADWAASMTAWGVRFTYHPGELRIDDGRWYEPDFLLPGAAEWAEDVLLEVKGDGVPGLDKVAQLQAANPDKRIIVGRAPFVAGYDRGEYGAARWEPADWVWEIRGEQFISGETVGETGLPGLNMFRAVRGTDKID